jgi:hypothetical protein
MVSPRYILASFATLGGAIAASSYPPYQVRNAGVPVGQLKNVSGSESCAEQQFELLVAD